MGQIERFGQHRLWISYRRPKTKENFIALIKKVSPQLLMLRNPKAFETWSICSCWAHSVITELEMLPSPITLEKKSTATMEKILHL
jgi:hypothetical protein